MAYVLGVDAGFGQGETCAWCVLSVQDADHVLQYEGSGAFNFANSSDTFQQVHNQFPDIQVVTLDAPIVPTRPPQRPQPRQMRAVERLFQSTLFAMTGQHGTHIAPSAWNDQEIGWPLGDAAQNTIVPSIQQFWPNLILRHWDYIVQSFQQNAMGAITGIFECIPKLTQAPLLPHALVRGRGDAQIDDWAFPHLFQQQGQHHGNLLRTEGLVGGYTLTNWEFVNNLILPRDHELAAAVVSAVQAASIRINTSMFIGCQGATENYFSLPKLPAWHIDWRNDFQTNKVARCTALGLTILPNLPAPPPP